MEAATTPSDVDLARELAGETKRALQSATTCLRRASFLESIVEDVEGGLGRWQQLEVRTRAAKAAAVQAASRRSSVGKALSESVVAAAVSVLAPGSDDQAATGDGGRYGGANEAQVLLVEAKLREAVALLRNRFVTPSCIHARVLQLFQAPLARKTLQDAEESLKMAAILCSATSNGGGAELRQRQTVKRDRRRRPPVDDAADHRENRVTLLNALQELREADPSVNRSALMEVSQWLRHEPDLDTALAIQGRAGTKRQRKASALLAKHLIDGLERASTTLPDASVHFDDPEVILGEGHFAQIVAGALAGKPKRNSKSASEDYRVAVKRVRKKRDDNVRLDDREALLREGQLWTALRHDNIVCLRGSCLGPDSSFQLVLDRCDISLQDVLYEKVDPDEPPELAMERAMAPMTQFGVGDKEAILRGIARGLAYLHSKNVMCGDLQPANVLLNRDFGLVKLANFELVTRGADAASRAPSYMAPEVLLDPAQWTTLADMYSFAIIVWELYHGQPPYSDVGLEDLETRVLHGERPDIAIEVGIRPWVSSIMERCWAHDPQRRLRAVEVLEKLEFRGSARQSTRIVRGLLTMFANSRVRHDRPSITSMSTMRMVQTLLKDLSDNPANLVRTLQSLHDALWREWRANKTDELRAEACSRGVVVDLKRILDKRLSPSHEASTASLASSSATGIDFEEDADEHQEIFTSVLWVLRYALSSTGAVALREAAVSSYGMGDRAAELLQAFPDSPEMQAAGCGAIGILAYASQRNAAYLVQDLRVGSEVVKALRRHPKDIAVLENACSALQRLANTDANRVTLGQDLDACRIVLDTMRAHAESETVQVNALGAISNLAVEDRNQEILGQDLLAGPTICEAMRVHWADGAVLRSACGALQNLAVNDTNQKTLCQELEVGPVILEAMRRHRKDPGVLRQACGALRNLASNNLRNKEILGFELNAGADIVRAMSVFPLDPGLQSEACDALLSLAEDDLRNAQILEQEVHAASEIVRAMATHREDALIQEKACDALLTLAMDDQNREILCQQLKVGVVIVDAMQVHRDNPIVQENACGALQNLASGSPRNKELLGQKLNVGVEIVLAMRTHADHAGVQEYACGALWNVAANSARNKEIFGQELNAGKEIIAAMRAHRESEGVQEQACGVLRTLSGDDRNKAILGRDLGAGADLVRAMHEFPDYAALQRNACAALQNLALDKANRDLFVRDLAVVDAVLESIDTHYTNASVQVNALGALQNLAARERRSGEVLGKDLTVAHVVAHVMREHQNQPKVLMIACGVFRNLAASSNSNKALLGQDEEVCTEILEAMRAHPEHPGVQQAACAALLVFASNSASRNKLRSLGAIDEVKLAKSRFPSLKGPQQALRKFNAWF